MTRIGVVSDVHEIRANGIKCISHLKKKDIDMIVLNGDIGEDRFTLKALLDETKGIRTFYQPAGHEGQDSIYCAQAAVIDLGKDFTLVRKPAIFEVDSNNLLFIPGADLVARGDAIQQGEDKRRKSGSKVVDLEMDLPDDSSREYYKGNVKFLNYSNHEDIEDLVEGKDASRIVVFNHVPSRFSGTAPDQLLYMGKAGTNVQIPLFEYVMKGDYYDRNYEKLEKRKKNVGSPELTRLYSKLGLRKLISGHIHEASHHAINTVMTPVMEGGKPVFEKDDRGRDVQKFEYAEVEGDEEVENLALNNGFGNWGSCSVVEVNGDKIKYEPYMADRAKFPEELQLDIEVANKFWYD